MDKKNPDKKERLLAVLDRGMVMIHLDARRPGVVVPEALRKEAHLRLNLSYRFDPPDLTVTEWGIRSTLSFSDVRHKVSVPWSAVFAMTSHVSKEFWMYPDDMPPELLQTPLPVKTTAAPVPVSPALSEASESQDPPKEPPVAAPRGHLRLVK
jgi:stringent starvation protein B